MSTNGINNIWNISDVKRGQNLEAEAEARATIPRPRPISGGWGQGRGQKSYEKDQIMINNIRFKIIVGKINKIPEFYTIFAPPPKRPII